MTLVFCLLAAASTPPGTSPVRYPESIEEVLREYPSRDANEAALALEALVAPVGIDLVPGHDPSNRRPDDEAVRRFREAQAGIADYLDRELGREDDGVDPPPTEVARFLAEHRARLESIEGAILTGELPHWERRLERLHQAPVPRLLGVLYLQKWMLADVLAREAAGDTSGAVRGLEASWELQRSFDYDPLLIVNLVSLGVVRYQCGALRHVKVEPAPWIEKLDRLDLRGPMMDSLAYEGWLLTQLVADPRRTERTDLPGRIVAIAERPYVRACLENISARWLEALETASVVGLSCDADFSGLDADFRSSLSWWNRMAKTTLTPFGMLGRLARTELDVAFTKKILEIRIAKAAKGTWPVPVSSDDGPACCPGVKWTFETNDGAVSLGIDPEPDWAGQMGLLLPMKFRSGS